MKFTHDLTFGDWITFNDPSADVALRTNRDDTAVSVDGDVVSLFVEDYDSREFVGPIEMTPEETVDLAFALMRAAHYAKRYDGR